MGINIKEIKVGELIEFSGSDSFNKLEFEPISRYRAKSYASNPRAEDDDIALLLAYDNGRLIGYLGMFTDMISHSQQKIKFCWFSCMWVLPEYRRSGIAIELLKEGYNKFGGLVMITNYIPRSKAAFLKTGQYEELEVLKGYRFYVKSDLNNIIIRKYSKAKAISPLLIAIDSVSNLFLSLLYTFKFHKRLTNYSFEVIDKIDQETAEFINNISKDSLFQRSAVELNWMQNFPWILNQKDPKIEYSKYYFSQYSSDFKQWFISVKNKAGQIIGFIIITRLKGELKTPYVFFKENPGADLGIFISDFIRRNKIRTVITYNQFIIGSIIQKKCFIFKKKSEYGFLATKPLFKLIKPLKKLVFDGDGDGAFT